MRKADWRVQQYLHPEKFTTKETFNFKSLRNPPKVPELDAFRHDFLNIMKNIKFVHKNSKFQKQLKEESNQIKATTNVIVAADKTSAHYEVEKIAYKKLVEKEIHKDYKIMPEENIHRINSAHKDIVRDLEIQDRVFKTVEKESFVSLKDHKSDFRNNPKCRLLAPMKCEIGKISQQILSKIVKVVRKKTKLNQWQNIYSCIDWYKSIRNKDQMNFIIFDIVSFYPSISESLLSKALDWASKFVRISNKDRNIILQARKSIVFYDGRYWMKKSDSEFDVPMGSYDGAEICDICALFILSELEKQKLNAIFGSYKDDGLALSRASARQTELIKKKICETFAKFGLKITIEANKKVVQFLDAEFDLRDESFKPFLKLGDTPQYVHVQSNHPPSILRNIPEAIQKRLSALSSDENKFNEVVPIYQEALNKSGYKFKLKYTPPTPTPDENKSKKKKRRRSRQVIWWNPPFSVNVKTNVGKIFFNLLKRHFPKEHPLHRIMNQNTVKMSYRTTPNMKNLI